LTRLLLGFRKLMRYSYRIPWCVPPLGRDELVATLRPLLTGRVVRGPEPERLAEDLRRVLGVAYVLPVNRGRTAIELALRGLGIGADDDVVLPTYLCDTALAGVLAVGARPVFADVGPDLHVTVESVEAALTPRRRCVLVAHLYGNTAPIDGIEALAAARGIAVVDDAAQSLGARRGGRLVGTFGAAGIVSSGPGKTLAGPAGGALVTNDAKLYRQAATVPLTHEPAGVVVRRAWDYWVWRRFRRVTFPAGMVLGRIRTPRAEPSHQPARLANLDAAVMRMLLKNLARNVELRRANLGGAARSVGPLAPLVLTNGGGDGTAVKLALVLPPEGPDRRTFLAAAAAAGVECQGWYQPLHLGLGSPPPPPGLPMAEALWERVVCVPLDGAWRGIEPGALVPASEAAAPGMATTV
jgi:dTDP-4-amino-4,6-dideoxygalactose transaminase